jgi:PAS domain S-box-containing protein
MVTTSRRAEILRVNEADASASASSGVDPNGSAGVTLPADVPELPFRQIIERAQDAIVFADRAGVIRFWNCGAEAIFGYRAEEAVGSTLDLIIPNRLRQRHWQGYRSVMAGGTTRYARQLLAVPAVRSDGTPISLELTITLLYDGAGTVAGAAAIIREVSQRWETVAHELRAPLTAVRTCVGLLRDPNVKPEPAVRAELLKTIEQSAERMQRLVADLLDLTRFRSGSIRLQLRRIDARALAREAAAAMTPLLEARGQQLDLALPGSPLWVYGDRRRLERALLNLLSNAQKFSPDGAHVRLSVAAQGDDVTWSVTDIGPGITAADQERLFERFFTGATNASREGADTGLGLPIAQAIALAHGGAIEVESAVGRGSTFTVRVPASGPDVEGEP